MSSGNPRHMNSEATMTYECKSDSYVSKLNFPFIKIKRLDVEKNFWLSIGGLKFEIKDVQYGKNQLWTTNQWQHFCLAFNVDMFHVSLIKVSTIVHS